jgi:hypothetical protein
MVLLIGRLFLLLLLIADYAGDPYFGQSPLSRPFSSQDAFCHSVVHRVAILRATTLSWRDVPIHHGTICPLTACDARQLVRHSKIEHLLPATDLLYALMSLRC